MLPSDMNLKIDNIENFNNKILVSKSDSSWVKMKKLTSPIVKAFEGPS